MVGMGCVWVCMCVCCVNVYMQRPPLLNPSILLIFIYSYSVQ